MLEAINRNPHRLCMYRLEKRVMVPLPAEAARELMLRKLLSDRAAPDLDYSEVYTAHICSHIYIRINVYR